MLLIKLILWLSMYVVCFKTILVCKLKEIFTYVYYNIVFILDE